MPRKALLKKTEIARWRIFSKCFSFIFLFFFSLMIYAMYAKGGAVSNLMLSEELAQEYKTRQVGTRQDKTNNYRPSDQQQGRI